MPGTDMDIAKNIKAVEWVKADLVDSLGNLFKNMVKGSMDTIVDSLALIIINCFLLVKRLGLSFGQLDIRVWEKTSALLEEGHPLEDWYKDLSSLKTYLEMKR